MSRSPDLVVEVKQARIELARAFVSETALLPENQRTLTLELAQRVNKFGQTLDGELPISTLFLPDRQWHRTPRARSTPEGELAWKLPKPITRVWNGTMRRLLTPRRMNINTIDQLRDPDTRIEELDTYLGRINPKLGAIVRAVVALPQ